MKTTNSYTPNTKGRNWVITLHLVSSLKHLSVLAVIVLHVLLKELLKYRCKKQIIIPHHDSRGVQQCVASENYQLHPQIIKHTTSPYKSILTYLTKKTKHTITVYIYMFTSVIQSSQRVRNNPSNQCGCHMLNSTLLSVVFQGMKEPSTPYTKWKKPSTKDTWRGSRTVKASKTAARE